MRRARRLFFAGTAALAAVACGLQVTGIDPAVTAADAGRDAPPPTGDVVSPPEPPDADAAAPTCDAGGAFCDLCDPTLVLCIEFDGLDGSIVDRSGYHRPIEVTGKPQFITAGQRTAISLDGSVDIRIPSGPGLDVETDDTLEIETRIVAAPDASARAGMIDRNGGMAMFVYGENGGSSISCHSLRSDAGVVPATFQRLTCVTTKEGAGKLFVGDTVVASTPDAARISAFSANEPFVIGHNSPDGDLYVGDISWLRLYARAKSPAEIREAGP